MEAQGQINEIPVKVEKYYEPKFEVRGINCNEWDSVKFSLSFL